MVQHELLIRAATAEDEAFAHSCHHAAMRDVVVRQFGSWDERVQDGFFDGWWRQGRARIIEVDGSAVGYLDVQERDDEVAVNEIVLLPSVHGRGIGTRVLGEVLSVGKPVVLQVLLENHRARALYERLGFVEVGGTSTHHLMRHPA